MRGPGRVRGAGSRWTCRLDCSMNCMISIIPEDSCVSFFSETPHDITVSHVADPWQASWTWSESGSACRSWAESGSACRSPIGTARSRLSAMGTPARLPNHSGTILSSWSSGRAQLSPVRGRPRRRCPNLYPAHAAIRARRWRHRRPQSTLVAPGATRRDHGAGPLATLHRGAKPQRPGMPPERWGHSGEPNPARNRRTTKKHFFQKSCRIPGGTAIRPQISTLM